MSTQGTTVLGICGPMGSGKTYVSNYLEFNFGFKLLAFATYLKLICQDIVKDVSNPFDDEAKKVNVGKSPFMPHKKTLIDHMISNEALKHIAKVVETTPLELAKFTLNTLQLHGPLISGDVIVYPPTWTFRDVLQIVGTEVFRFKFGADIWVRMVRSQIAELTAMGVSRFIITDVRYLNEAEFVRELGGSVIKLSISPHATWKRNDGGTSNHASEVELQRIVGDLNVENDYSTHPVEAVVQYVMKKL